ncbi:hypothetical protein ACTHPH_16455 [Paenibacillus pasadenensis]|uniref:Uncharacterized protein n=2 Tax=Paenibacillus pasadenensis TaxID=217090 RepID=A0A2N5N0W2_9BACL|nr:hypothetical protein B8V81_2386 [Paenibacillus pasadenensis]
MQDGSASSLSASPHGSGARRDADGSMPPRRSPAGQKGSSADGRGGLADISA